MLNNLFAADVKRKMMNLKQHDLIVQYLVVRRDGVMYRVIESARIDGMDCISVKSKDKEVEDCQDQGQAQELHVEILGKIYKYKKISEKLNNLVGLSEMRLKFIGEAR